MIFNDAKEMLKKKKERKKERKKKRKKERESMPKKKGNKIKYKKKIKFSGNIAHVSETCNTVFVAVAGNTNPYFVSYIRKHSSPSDLRYINGIWVQACMLMGQGVTMFLGGILEQKVGLRIACLIGSWMLRFVLIGPWMVSLE